MKKSASSLFPTTLVFDTTLRDQTTVALIYHGKTKMVTAPVRAQELQRLSIELLVSMKLSIEQVESVAVLSGPGSFTGTRIGVVAANTLGWFLDLPIMELPGSDIHQAIEIILKKSVKPVRQATARY